MEELIRYTCRECRYKFRRKKDWDGVKCPFCDKIAIEREDTINKMIRDEL
ncbi:MAG: hypothetical protein Q8Q35_02875 [Nanoarchaeota archaeon]|nr:hypothetical protein [Nanoarchaeota archaeon]